MSVLESLKQGIRKHFEKKRLDKEHIEEIRRDNSIEAQQVFEDEFRKNNRKVLIDKAKKEASKKSGLQRFRAENRLRNLQKEQNPENFWSKMREHTQKNLANREKNLQDSKARMKLAKEMREEQLAKRQQQRNTSFNRKPFSRY